MLRAIGEPPWAEGAGVVVQGGEIDVSAHAEFEAKVRAAERAGGDLYLDLSDATFIDSSGVTVVYDAAERARTRGSHVTVRITNRLLRRVFRMMFLDEVVTIEPPLGPADYRDGPTVLPL